MGGRWQHTRVAMPVAAGSLRVVPLSLFGAADARGRFD
jgi:hypothetical protein